VPLKPLLRLQRLDRWLPPSGNTPSTPSDEMVRPWKRDVQTAVDDTRRAARKGPQPGFLAYLFVSGAACGSSKPLKTVSKRNSGISDAATRQPIPLHGNPP
jgi:hypothetical protein